MTEPVLPPDDQRALDAFNDVAALPATSPFQTARAHKDFEAALDRRARAHLGWTTPRLAAVALSGAFAGAAAVLVAIGVGTFGAPASTSSQLGSSSTHASSSQAAIASSSSSATTPTPAKNVDVQPSAAHTAIALETPATPSKPKAAARVKGWREESQKVMAAGDGVAAARVLVRALATDDAAAASIAVLARRYPDALEAVDADLAALKNAEAMRIRCEQKLLHARDKSALDACLAFSREHADVTGARTLAFAAGRLAEDDLGDLAAAEEAYSRALLLSPFAGLPGTDALLARARVREQLGNLDEARADLRLYLANEPVGRNDDAVRSLAERLGL